MIRSGSARTGRPTSRSSIWRRCARCRTCACSARPTRWRPPECWQLALENLTGPTVLALSRQNLPRSRTSASSDNLCRHGGYELVAATGEAKVSLFASGSEVEIAVAAQKQLAARGIAARVVSVPSLELLLAQPPERRAGDHRPRPGQGRDRGRGPVRLGCRDRAGRDLRRHERLRRQRAGQGPLQAFRDHRGGGGRGCVKAPECEVALLECSGL